MHTNSLEAYKEISFNGVKDKRSRMILEVFLKFEFEELSDWDVLQELFRGSDNMNLVSPRITGLYKPCEENGNLPYLEEGKPIQSRFGNRKVRTSKLFNRNIQQSLF